MGKVYEAPQIIKLTLSADEPFARYESNCEVLSIGGETGTVSECMKNDPDYWEGFAQDVGGGFQCGDNYYA